MKLTSTNFGLLVTLGVFAPACTAGFIGLIAKEGSGAARAAETAAGGVTSGSVAGGIGAGTSNGRRMVRSASFNLLRRDGDYPPGVSDESIDQCIGAVNDQFNNDGTSVQIHEDNGNVILDNVPAPCMNLATVLSGNPAQAGGPVPTTLGSSTLSFSDLTQEERQTVQEVLDI